MAEFEPRVGSVDAGNGKCWDTARSTAQRFLPPSFHYRGSEYVRKASGYVRKGSGLYCTRRSRLDYVSRPCAGPALVKRTLGIPGPRRSELVCAVMQRVGAAFVSWAPSCRGTWLFLVSASGVSLPLRIPGCGSTPLNVR